jgi:putative membrane protein
MRVSPLVVGRWSFVVLLACPAVVLAHGDDTLTSPSALSPFDLLALAFLITIGVLYAVGTARLSCRHAIQGWFEPAAFAAGWSALMVAVLPPLDAWAVQRFSAHMFQHELMMLVGAPLIVAGRPIPVWLAALPQPSRSRFAAVLQSRATHGAWNAVTAPIVAWTLHGAAIWVWHLPALYDLAVDNEAIHLVQHGMFVGTAIVFWWGMLYGRYGRAGYGAAVFYVFTTAVHTGILGAMVTFAGAPLYSVYLAPAAAGGVDPLGDQQIAGLIMWVPAGLVLTTLGIALFAAWLGEAERRARTGTAAIDRAARVLVSHASHTTRD